MNPYLEYHKANPGKIYAGSVWDRERCWSLEAEHGMLRYWAGQAVSSKGKVIGNYFSEIFEYHVSWGASVGACQSLAQWLFAFESNQTLQYMGTAPAA